MKGARRLGRTFSASIIGLALLTSSTAWAGPADNILGLGARTVAMGGAGTTLVEDATAVYYNPARLTECQSSEVTFGLHHVSYGFKLNDSGSAETKFRDLKNHNRPFLGACIQLPFDMAFGLLLSMGLKEPFSYNQETPNDRARLILYGQPLETVSLAGGGAIRPIPQLALGGSVSLALDANILLSAEVPILGTGIGEANARAQIGFTYAFVVGGSFEVSDSLVLGAAVRTGSAVRFHARAPINANVAGVEVIVPIVMDVTDDFSPLQLAFGATLRPLEHLTLVADVTWYQWSKFVQPFLDMRGEGDSSIARELQFEPLEPANFRNIVVPRLGAELGVLEDAMHLRAGYAFRPSPAPLPTGKANLLDAATHSLSAGLGYSFGSVISAKDHEVECNSSIDAFVRLDAMQKTSFDKPTNTGTRHIEFGGSTFEVGLSYRLGWQ